MKYFFNLLWLSLLSGLQMTALSQSAGSKWRDYLSFNNAEKVCVASQKIYVATSGGLIYFNLEDNNIYRVSDFLQLSDFGIKTIGYNEATEMLVIVYENCNIDFIKENRIINLSDIKRKQITGKSINNISFEGKEAYLSCSFGIVVLNLERLEVKDTYVIGEGGSYLNVNDTGLDSENIYAATNSGLYRAARNSSNLLDYNSWKRITDIPRSWSKFNHITTHAGSILVNYTPDRWDDDEIYILSENGWERYLSEIRYISDIQSNGTKMAVVARDWVYIVDDQHKIERVLRGYQGLTDVSPNPKSAAITSDGALWIADDGLSLVCVRDDDFEVISPLGPSDNKVFSLTHGNSELWVTSGVMEGWEYAAFRRLKDGVWNNFTMRTYPELKEIFNILEVAVHPNDPSHIFAASWGGGVVEFKNDLFVKQHSNFNSLLTSALPDEPDAPYVRVGGLAFDSEGNLWMTNSEALYNLVKYSSDGKWDTISLPEVASRYGIGQLLVTKNDDKWVVILKGNDAYVVDKTGKQKRQLKVSSYFNNGQQVIINDMNEIYSIAEDRKGAVWLGTSKGVAVYNYPARIWQTDPFYAIQPSLDLGDGLYHPLLETEVITAIAVDGANRKWLGTSNSGLYLVSEDGTKEILHFTVENSPLISNRITALAINQKSGEVFIGTDRGLISYQSDAIGPKNNFSNIYVYPNPVRETYDGPVTITGLMENSDVKITDISGNLVYKATSLGGQVQWDGKTIKGNRAKTGVYLVFCTDKFGEETAIEKLLFIH